jgi:2'-5' RNA ligase
MVPDEKDASTWRLPLWREGADGPDDALIRYAVSRMSPDVAPTIPHHLGRKVRARIRRAYRRAHGTNAPIPEAVAKALDLFQAGEGRGVMVAFAPEPATADALAVQAVAGIEPEPPQQIHLTLAYLGTVEEWPEDKLDVVRAVVGRYCSERWYLYGHVSGGGIFALDPILAGYEGCAVALADVPGLAAFRTGLVDALADAGIWVATDHDFTPHLTVAWGTLDALQALPVPAPHDVTFRDALVVAGTRVDRYPCAGLLSDAPQDPGVVASSILSTIKSAEMRYTFAPMYVPGIADGHDEVMSADDLQRMVWDYNVAHDKAVRFSHVPETVAGQCVEMCAWPTEQTVTMIEADGTEHSVTLPPGTVYAGVVWEPWAWADVKSGLIRAYSWGGWSKRAPAGAV